MKVDIDNFNPVKTLEFVLVFVLLAALASSVVPFLGKYQAMAIAPTTTKQSLPLPNTALIDIAVLRNFDLFHREKITASSPMPVIEYAPETTLDLEVFGMRANINGDTSSAIIKTPDDKQAIYFLGDEIISDVYLKQVEIDYVILERNGMAERLSRQGKTESDAEVTGAIAGVLSFKAQEMIRDLRLYPHREGRNIIGYGVRSQHEQSLSKYGFQQNDIITTINDESLAQSRVHIPDILKSLKQSRHARIQLIRDGKPMTLEVSLQ